MDWEYKTPCPHHSPNVGHNPKAGIYAQGQTMFQVSIFFGASS